MTGNFNDPRTRMNEIFFSKIHKEKLVCFPPNICELEEGELYQFDQQLYSILINKRLFPKAIKTKILNCFYFQIFEKLEIHFLYNYLELDIDYKSSILLSSFQFPENTEFYNKLNYYYTHIKTSERSETFSQLNLHKKNENFQIKKSKCSSPSVHKFHSNLKESVSLISKKNNTSQNMKPVFSTESSLMYESNSLSSQNLHFSEKEPTKQQNVNLSSSKNYFEDFKENIIKFSISKFKEFYDIKFLKFLYSKIEKFMNDSSLGESIFLEFQGKTHYPKFLTFRYQRL